jgi:hypothetical protein
VQYVVLQLLFDFVNEFLINRHEPCSDHHVASCGACTLSNSFLPSLQLVDARILTAATRPPSIDLRTPLGRRATVSQQSVV